MKIYRKLNIPSPFSPLGEQNIGPGFLGPGQGFGVEKEPGWAFPGLGLGRTKGLFVVARATVSFLRCSVKNYRAVKN